MNNTVSNFNRNIRRLQLVNHLLVLFGIYLLITQSISTNYLYIGIIGYVWFVLFGTTIGLHRYFSHHSFKANKFWHYFLAVTGTLCTVGTVIGWVGLHRYHHAHTDTEEDPHDPRRIGIFNAWFYNWKPSKFTKKFIRQELGDKLLVFLHKHYFKVIFAYILLLLIIDPVLVIFLYCLPACGSYLAISAVTVIGHMHGYVTTDVNDNARNSWITSLLSMGEGWHNNHHAFPYNHRQGHQYWELDPSAWVIENIIDRSKKHAPS